MFYLLKIFFKDPWVLVPLVASALSQSFMWFYILRNLSSRSDNLFLHYNIIFGVDLVGSWWKILYLPLGGLAIIFANYLLSLWLYNTDKIIARMLTIFCGVFLLFLSLAVYLIVDINL
jgi:hypothetical protein